MGIAVERDYAALNRIVERAVVIATKMIYDANQRSDAEPGDPKVGGHPAAASSSAHLLGALHLVVRNPQDWLASKPHASPMDHAVSYLLGLFRDKTTGHWLDDQAGRAVMARLRKFAVEGEPVFQSYHAESDPDFHGMLPSGSVGIPAVTALFFALAHRYAEDHGFAPPRDAHFWALIGDSEFREGSLLEALPEAAERRLGNVTWIIDYNRQSLDGPRITNQAALHGTDADRIERTARANGWHVVQLRHGTKRERLFDAEGGVTLRRVIEEGFSDAEFQALLLAASGRRIRQELVAKKAELATSLEKLTDDELYDIFADLGGHDLRRVIAALEQSKADPTRPTLIIAHTIKGWGLQMAATPGNHSALPSTAEMKQLLEREGLTEEPYQGFPKSSAAGRLLESRGWELRQGIEQLDDLKRKRQIDLQREIKASGGLPRTFDIGLKLVPTIHTQWMWGQVAAKLVRLGSQSADESPAPQDSSPSPIERAWRVAGAYALTLAPDVGTSTNLSPTMDGRVYGPEQGRDFEQAYEVHDRKRPSLAPTQAIDSRHLRFEIAEANSMCAAGAFGKMGDALGIPLMPMMTIYDFFIKRAYDQLFYNLYWNASFILIGTPSGVTLSPEGAQHSWKSDIQMPNMITWEPMYVLELDWIVADAARRHFLGDNEGRRGVLVRAVTRSLKQAELLLRLRRHRSFKKNMPVDRYLVASQHRSDADRGVLEAEIPAISDSEIHQQLKEHVLAGGYYLVDYRGYLDYEPAENVVHIFCMGAVGSEALIASDRLFEQGIYANVIVVTSPDLLVGTLARAGDYRHLRHTLGISGDLHLRLQAKHDVAIAGGRRVPVVSVCDGEPGLLDNIGGVVGVRQIALGVRRASKSGRPSDVYAYHGLDAAHIVEACGKVLAETALDNIRISHSAMPSSELPAARSQTWRDLWPARSQ